MRCTVPTRPPVNALYRADAASSQCAVPRWRGDAAAGHYMFVNGQPARRLCLPDLAPAQAIVRAGERTGRCGIVALARGWPCGSGAALSSRVVGFAFLSRRFSSVRVRRCVSGAALPSRAVGLAVLARRFSSVHARLCGSVAALFLGARPALRSCRGAFPRFTPAVCLATNRTACDMLRSYSAGSRSPFARSRGVSAVICLCWFTSGLAVSLWRSRRGTKRRGGRGDGERGWRRGACASLRNHIGLVMLSAGSPLGAARPQTCAKESSTLWTLFTLRRGWGGADSLRRHPGTIGDLTGSNLWPGRSCGRTIAPTRSNVQTRAARRQRRGVGFQRAERSGSGTAASLDSLHAAAGLGWCGFAAPSPGHYRRPDRL